MHIDVLDKTLDISPEKSKNILSKTKIIVDNSIDELRSTVYSLKKNNINVTIRKEFGKGIDAACGQLRAKEVNKE